MKSRLLYAFLLLCCVQFAYAQSNVGIGTTSPQANLDVHGTFKLQNGVIVNGISADSTFTPGSDSLMPTQLAVKRYLKSGAWAPSSDGPDSILYQVDYSTVDNIISGVDARDSLVFATSRGSTNYLNIFDVSDPANIVLRSRTSAHMNSPVEVKVSGDFAFVLNDEIFYNCLSIFDISNPDTIISVSQALDYIPNPADLDIVGNYAYIVSRNGWFTIYDVTNPYAPALSSYTFTNLSFPTAVEVANGIAYVTSEENSRLCLFDITDPDNIVPMGFVTDSILFPTHLDIEGDYIYVTSQKGVTIFDNSDPNNINVAGMIPPAYGFPVQIHVNANIAYVAMPNVGELKAFDIADPSTPRFLGSINGFGDFYDNTLISKFDTEGDFIYAGSAVQHSIGAIRWVMIPNSQVLVKETAGGPSFVTNYWQKDSLSNLFALDINNVGIGTYFPSAKLHLNGQMKIDGTNTIEFGAGVKGKQIDAGKIGYNTFSGNALDIVGAGSSGARKIKFYAEGGATFQGKIGVTDSLFVDGHSKLDGNLTVNTGWVGIGNSAPTVPLHLTGNMKIDSTGTMEFGAGIINKQVDAGKIGYRSFSTDALDIIGAGTNPFDRKLKFFAEGGSLFTGGVGMTGNLLVNNGWVGINNSSPEVPLHLSGKMKIDSTYTLEFGAGIYGKQSDAGKIGYQAFTPNALDIVGAGSVNHRRIRLWAEDGVKIDGKLIVSDTITGSNAKFSGKVGIGTATPSATLHIAGNQKIDGTYTLEFGAGIAGKQADAGKIGYTLYSTGLDIIGAGAPNQRRIKLWAEAGTTVEGKLLVTDSLRVQGNGLFQNNLTVNGNNFVVNGNLGAGTSAPAYKLDVNGRMRLRHNGETSGIYFNKSNNTEEGFIGMFSDNAIGLYGAGGGGWNMVMNTTNGNVGIGTTNPTATLHVGGNQKMNGVNTIEFGSDVAGKNQDAGKIGYQTYSPGALDIVGAGNSAGNRKVNIWDILSVDSIQAGAIASGEWINAVLYNNWQNYGNGFATAAVYMDPMGVVHFRGTISGGDITPGTVLFNVVPDYAPAYGKLIFLVPNGAGGTSRIEVHPNGDFVLYGNSNAWLSLDQISYRVY